MAVYFTNRVGQGAISNGSTASCCAWSQFTDEKNKPLLAVGSTSGAVGVYTDEGEPLSKENDPTLRGRGANPTALQWHPTSRLLAVGWGDGVLSFWNEQERRLSEDKQAHTSPIRCMKWSSDGTRLITGDGAGKILVWKVERARPVPVVQYSERGGNVTHVCFAENPSSTGKPDEAKTFFYCSTSQETTIVCQADDKGHKTQLYEMDTPAAALLYYREKTAVVSLSKASILTVHAKQDAGWKTLTKVKLPTVEGMSSMQVAWAGTHVLASASDQDSMVRMFNLHTEENFVLTLGDEHALKKISSLAFNTGTNSLAAGTKEGVVVLWRYVGTPSSKSILKRDHNPEDDWHLQPGTNVNSSVEAILWGPNMRLMAVMCPESAFILSRNVLQHKIRNGMAAIQLTAEKVVVEDMNAERSQGVKNIVTELQVSGVDVTETHLALWTGRKAEIYEINRGESSLLSSFATNGTSCGLHRDSFLSNSGSRVLLCNFLGTVKQTLVFDELQGTVTHINVNGDYLVAVTTKHFIKMWKLTGREAKPHGPGPGRKIEFPGVNSPLGAVESIQVNCHGTKVSVVSASHENSAKMDSRVVIYDSENDNFSLYDFATTNRYPTGHYWDVEEPKLLAVETRLLETRSNEDVTSLIEESDPSDEMEVTTLFSSSDDGVLFQSSTRPGRGYEGICGIHVPHLYCYKKINPDLPVPEIKYVEGLLLKDFSGLENVDDKSRKALLNFSFFLAVGNMDEAYKAVKLIKTPTVWENMAHMCIKTKRLDVAEYCISNMGNIRGARALREAAEYKEVDARVGTVAVHLGLIDDARKLFAGCERFDLLNNLFQACGEWEKAINVAGEHDRIHLRTTYYKYAKHLQSIGDFRNATHAYEKSGTHLVEVPRMLYEREELEELERYILTKKDKDLTKWWARYCESNGETDKALDCYQAAEDYLSLVRVHCLREEFDLAREIAMESGNLAASYHLGRQYENQDNIPEAILFYSRAKRYSNAIQLAKRQGMDNELNNLALQASKREQVDVARYFEDKEMFDRAVLLYQKGGNTARALDLCFRRQLFEQLCTIASDLGDDTDPVLLRKCADFFLEHGQFKEVVRLLVSGKDYERALGMAIDHNILISEEMAEAMTPGKDSPLSTEEKQSMLRRIAKCCKRQGSYHLACKKYTQAGDKDKAMKTLLKSGDTEKIIFFAGVSRQREIYIMAANYLQTLDWHNDAEVMKAIIQFYTKARAMDSLGTFYEACAQIEIDEYRDYEKALGALRESLKYMMKARNLDKDERIQSLNTRINLCDKFVQARKMLKTDPKQMVTICNGLLEYSPADAAEVDSAIRIGDVFALLVEYHQTQQNFDEAYKLIRKMEDRKIILSPYLDQEMVNNIYKAMGVAVPVRAQEDDDAVGEEIDEALSP